VMIDAVTFANKIKSIYRQLLVSRATLNDSVIMSGIGHSN